MAPVEPDLHNSNLRPLSIFSGYLVLAVALTGLVSYDVLYKASRALPPSQDTRHRQSSRKKHLQIFAGLAAISLAVTWYHMLQYFALSYRVWAYEMGEVSGPTISGENGFLTMGISRLSLGRWLRDTALFRDAWEIVIERSRRYWWSQQIFLGAAAWAVFVGVEGRRRNIRHLWAFLLLGQIVAMSFAMNLFFLAVLLTPVPLPRGQSQIGDSVIHKRSSSKASPAFAKIINGTETAINRSWSTIKTFLPPLITRPHPPEWTPHPAAIIAPLTALYACVFLLPFSVSTPQFWPFLLIPHLVCFRPVYLDRLAPLAYGSTKQPHRTYLAVYCFVSYASLFLYIKQTLVAVLDNDPGAYKHRHSYYLASLHLPPDHDRSVIQRTTSSLSRVLSSLSDHPAVASVGWDVLFCAISLATWAAVRGLDISRIAAAAGLIRTPNTVRQGPSSNPKHARSTSTTSNGIALGDTDPSTKVRRRRKPSTKAQAEGEATEKVGDDDDFSPGRAVAPVVLGEEEEDANLEAGAVSWALFALGGLGALASGVLGAEFDT